MDSALKQRIYVVSLTNDTCTNEITNAIIARSENSAKLCCVEVVEGMCNSKECLELRPVNNNNQQEAYISKFHNLVVASYGDVALPSLRKQAISFSTISHVCDVVCSQVLSPLLQDIGDNIDLVLISRDNNSFDLSKWITLILLCSSPSISAIVGVTASDNLEFADFDLHEAGFQPCPRGVSREDEEAAVRLQLTKALEATGWLLDQVSFPRAAFPYECFDCFFQRAHLLVVRCCCALRKQCRHIDALAGRRRDLGLFLGGGAGNSVATPDAAEEEQIDGILDATDGGWGPAPKNLKPLPTAEQGLSVYEFFSGIG